MFSIWHTNKAEFMQFIEQANNHHKTIKFMAKISYNVFKGKRFTKESTLDIKMHFKPTETSVHNTIQRCLI